MMRPLATSLLIVFAILFGAQTVFGLDADTVRAKAPSHGVTVLQNRYFHKQYRPEVGVLAGRFLNDAYKKISTYGFRINYFPSEWFGIEFQQLKTDVSDTEDLRALQELTFRELESDKVVYPTPEVNPIRGTRDISIVTVPFYGKLNLFNKMIIYSDLHVLAGMTFVDTDQGELQGYAFGAGQRFYIGKSVSINLDLRNRSYKEERNNKQILKSALSIDLGASYYLL